MEDSRKAGAEFASAADAQEEAMEEWTGDIYEIASEADALKAVEWNTELRHLDFIPRRFLTPAVCLKAVQRLGSLLKEVPQHLKSPEICPAAVKHCPQALQYVPKKLLTEEMCLDALRDYPLAITSIPQPQRTTAMALAAVVSSGLALMHVPEQIATEEVCLAACTNSGAALRYVPRNLRTDWICWTAVGQNGMALRWVPEDLRTPGICRRAVLENTQAMRFVPARLRTEALCLECVRSDGTALKWIPEALRTPAVCQAAVEENGEALRWLPRELRSAKLIAEGMRQFRTPPDSLPKGFQEIARGVGQQRAYSRERLNWSMACLGEALAYAVLVVGEEPDAFFEAFIASGLAERFGKGSEPPAGGGSLRRDWTETTHHAGEQLAQTVLEWRGAAGKWPRRPRGGFDLAYTPEYRAGWALAWYQWRRNEPLKDIIADAPLAGILRLVLPHRRAELAAFGQALDALRAPARDRREGAN